MFVRRFFKDSMIYGISSTIQRLFAFLLLPLYTKVLLPEEFGVADILNILMLLASITVTLEIGQAFARYFTDCSEDAKYAYASNAFWFTCITYIAFAAIFISYSDELARIILGDIKYEHIFKVAVFTACSNGLFRQVNNQLRWELRPVSYAVMSIVQLVITTAVSIVLVLIYKIGVLGIIYGQLVGYAAATIIGIYQINYKYRMIFDWSKFKEMLKFSIPMVPSGLGVIVSVYADRMAINFIMGLSAVGIYGLGFRLAGIAQLLMYPIIDSFVPLVYENYRKVRTPQDIATAFRYFIFVALAVVMFLSMYSREFYVLFTVPAYYGAAVVVPLLTPAIILGNMYIFAPGLLISKKTYIIAIISILGATLNITLNIALIPHFGITGSALATMISSLATFVTYVIFNQRYYRIPYQWGIVIPSAIVTAFAIYFASFIRYDFTVNIILKMFLIITTMIGYIFIGLINKNEIRLLVNRIKKRIHGNEAPTAAYEDS